MRLASWAVLLVVVLFLLTSAPVQAKNRIKKQGGWKDHEIGAVHQNAHHGADFVAKALKKPQKAVDEKMKELGYHQHVPKRPRASAARKILDRMSEL